VNNFNSLKRIFFTFLAQISKTVGELFFRTRRIQKIGVYNAYSNDNEVMAK